MDTMLTSLGVKQSGIGRELGEAGLEAYTNKKVQNLPMTAETY